VARRTTPDLSILGCRHPYGTPHRPWCEVVLDLDEVGRLVPPPVPVDPMAGLIDTYDPDDRQPMAGDPYWSDDPR
jgi:hypothetical protein